MTAPRVRRSAVLGALTLLTIVVAHELIYGLVYGAGDAYDAAMSGAGHGSYWASFALFVGGATVALALIVGAQVARLHRRAAAMASTNSRRTDDGPEFARILARRWIAVAAASIVAYVAQENLERVASGASAPGFATLAGEHLVALPVLLAVALAVAAAASLVAWRRDVLLSRMRLCAGPPSRTTATAHRPAGDVVLAGLRGPRLHGVRAPPRAAFAHSPS